MRAGRLRHRLSIQEPPASGDVSGEYSGDWTDLITVWGEVRPAGGGEKTVDSQTLSEVTHAVTLRWLALPTDRDNGAWNHLRIHWASEGRTFGIVAAVDADARHRTLELQCKELT